MMMDKLLLSLTALCLQIHDIRGEGTQLPEKRNKRLSNLETTITSIQNDLVKITSRLDEFKNVSTEMSEFKLLLNEFQKVSTMSKTLDTIQDGLANEKQQSVQLGYMAQETRNLINNQHKLFEKKTGLLENKIQTCLTTYNSIAKDCWDLKAMHNASEDGVYVLLTPDGRIISVRCDMTTDGGGWTVIQRRGNGVVRFANTYEEYKSFFGKLRTEFWMGNDFLNMFTHHSKQTLRVDICDWDNEARWAEYKNFSVGPSADKYRLSVEDYSGTAGDVLTKGDGRSKWIHNGQPFSAPGVDNDNHGSRDCASHYHSGWWFNECFGANLNGVYQHYTETHHGIQWNTWKNKYSLKGSEMKIRPSTASPSTSSPFKCPVI